MTERRTQCRLIETLRGEPLLVSCSPVRALQMFKCATCQIPEAVCSAAPVKTVYSGPGRLVEWDTSGATVLHAGARSLANVLMMHATGLPSGRGRPGTARGARGHSVRASPVACSCRQSL